MEDPFTNSQIDVDVLPSLETLNLIELHKDYLTAKMISNLIFWLIILVSGGTAWFFLVDKLPGFLKIIAPIIIILIVISSFLLTYFGFKKKKYALREKDILYQSGLLWRHKTVIPFNRIQHAEVTQGPIQRMFDLSVLRIFTAGGSSSDMSIPGIPPQKAHNIKEYVLGKTAADEEE